jgi:hypothetical protein
VFPEGAVFADPGGGIPHGSGSKAAAVDAAIDFAPEQSGGFQHAKMLRDGWERDPEGRGDLRDGGFAMRQARQNGAARGIGEGAESGVKRDVAGGRRIVNHLV